MLQIQLKLKSFNLYYIKLATHFIYSICSDLNIISTQETVLPIQLKKFTVLRSPHIDKNSREQFQQKTYKKIIQLNSINHSLAYFLIDILKNSELVGIELEINIKFLEYFKQK
jgi:small subunit ribosomal protein S10